MRDSNSERSACNRAEFKGKSSLQGLQCLPCGDDVGAVSILWRGRYESGERGFRFVDMIGAAFDEPRIEQRVVLARIDGHGAVPRFDCVWIVALARVDHAEGVERQR